MAKRWPVISTWRVGPRRTPYHPLVLPFRSLSLLVPLTCNGGGWDGAERGLGYDDHERLLKVRSLINMDPHLNAELVSWNSHVVTCMEVSATCKYSTFSARQVISILTTRSSALLRLCPHVLRRSALRLVASMGGTVDPVPPQPVHHAHDSDALRHATRSLMAKLLV